MALVGYIFKGLLLGSYMYMCQGLWNESQVPNHAVIPRRLPSRHKPKQWLTSHDRKWFQMFAIFSNKKGAFIACRWVWWLD